ncbi:FHA domain-containing protein [Myxacorys almedinensis]|uniref:FHA domain-containing protein n=1 Tax=Myxacorys almedinensis A TaxID=2690445 RepID=A0A8J7Z3J1_9CYAN|nr:FHA domain-containing protein [Myxacorys almedinensis]NDJ17186.1 FHA domain-containing protein [Myxacorys almedinensis A]
MTSASQIIHRLLVDDDRGRREYTLTASMYLIGRDPRCDICLFSQFVSRRHATIIQLPTEDGRYFYRIVDGTLKGRLSANGLLIGGRKLKSHELQNADEIVFGSHVKATYYQLNQESGLANDGSAMDTVIPDSF